MSRRTYAGTVVDVTFDQVLCRHAAECVRGLPAVFEPGRRPWIDPDAAEAEAVIRTVGRCPSGALAIGADHRASTSRPPHQESTQMIRDERGAAIEVRDAPARERYEVTVDGELAGFAEYAETAADRIEFTHTEIAPRFGRQGLGTRLIADALADARARERAIVPLCPFVAAYVRDHPEYLPFLDARVRPRFG